MHDSAKYSKVFQKLYNVAFFVARQMYRVFLVVPIRLAATMYFKPQYHVEKQKKVSTCVFVTSVVYPWTDKKVTHGGLRSIFSTSERILQTKQTVQSIRERLPDAVIVLLEGGSRKELEGLEDSVDQYIYLGNKWLVRLATSSKSKSFGEVIILLYGACKYRSYNAAYFFKISGRYFFDERFDRTKWPESRFTFFRHRADFYSTRLYGFSGDMFPVWKRALIKGLPLNMIGYAIENTVIKYIPKQYFNLLPEVGVSGAGASDNLIIHE